MPVWTRVLPQKETWLESLPFNFFLISLSTKSLNVFFAVSLLWVALFLKYLNSFIKRFNCSPLHLDFLCEERVLNHFFMMETTRDSIMFPELNGRTNYSLSPKSKCSYSGLSLDKHLSSVTEVQGRLTPCKSSSLPQIMLSIRLQKPLRNILLIFSILAHSKSASKPPTPARTILHYKNQSKFCIHASLMHSIWNLSWTWLLTELGQTSLHFSLPHTASGNIQQQRKKSATQSS